MAGFPTFRRAGEPWAACNFCGFAFPVSEMSVHYRNKKLVCHLDVDEPSQSDYMEMWTQTEERTDVSPQPVPQTEEDSP